ncbi:hypothetical protein D3C75_965770 [compost metagenome]
MMIHKQLLHIIVGSAIGLMVVEPDHIRLPVDVIRVAQHRGVAGKPHRMGIALQPCHESGLYQGIVVGVAPGGVFPQEHLGLIRLEAVVTVHIGQEPLR